jgi:hypothetical protein
VKTEEKQLFNTRLNLRRKLLRHTFYFKFELENSSVYQIPKFLFAEFPTDIFSEYVAKTIAHDSFLAKQSFENRNRNKSSSF